MDYRRDIDGLRAIAVLPVVGFHSGLTIFSGGYVGVDVFFVISGYLITSLIMKEVSEDRFSFADFYSRRIARLAPALIITLFMVMSWGFVFYHNQAFDKLGKEIFYSSFGLANILFAQGVDYFAKDEAYQPLIHLWSLGVEEQFYLLWPLILLMAHKIHSKVTVFLCLVLFFLSLWLSIQAVEGGVTKGYFLLHYRAFELLIGALLAIILFINSRPLQRSVVNSVMPWLGMAMIVTPIVFLDKASNFPGLNALVPCIGTMIIIAFPGDGLITKILSNRCIVGIGLISYPLYLYHQPIISFLHYFNLNDYSLVTFVIASVTSGGLAWLTYEYVEKALKRSVTANGRTNHKKRNYLVRALIALLLTMAALGAAIAKTNGFEQRFIYLNPFSYELSVMNSSIFHRKFKRGMNISKGPSSALFVGDSVLQHYIVPISDAFNLQYKEVDTVTRGGCVLLNGVDFKDTFSDISCNSLRDNLYESDKKYKYVFISQSWESYNEKITNFKGKASDLRNWTEHINKTIQHFSDLADNIILIGGHPIIRTSMELQPSLTVSKTNYISLLEKIIVENKTSLEKTRSYFDSFKEIGNVMVLHPYDIFCEEKCELHNGEWSYFSDQEHLSQAGSEFVEAQLLEKLRIVD